MRSLTTDVLVIGGGATGAGVLRDLALRGIRAVLVEKGDLTHALPAQIEDVTFAKNGYEQQHKACKHEAITGKNHLGRNVARCNSKHCIAILDGRIRTPPQQAAKGGKQKNYFAV